MGKKKTVAKKVTVKKQAPKKTTTKEKKNFISALSKKAKALKELANAKPPIRYPIVSNRIKTPDGTILVSRSVHDYVDYKDKVTGGYFAVDGGHEYLKRNFNGRYEEMSVHTNDNFQLIRYVMEWGTYGIKGDQPLQYRTLMHMSNSHIEAILKTQPHVRGWAKKIFLKELKYRAKKNIVIEDRLHESEVKQEHAEIVKKNLKPKIKAK